MPTGGKPLLFGDLFRNRAAQVTLGLAAGGFALALSGVLSATPALFGLGAAVAGGAGALAVWNLATGPSLALARRATKREAVTACADRKSGVEGKSVSVRLELGG